MYFIHYFFILVFYNTLYCTVFGSGFPPGGTFSIDIISSKPSETKNVSIQDPISVYNQEYIAVILNLLFTSEIFRKNLRNYDLNLDIKQIMFNFIDNYEKNDNIILKIYELNLLCIFLNLKYNGILTSSNKILRDLIYRLKNEDFLEFDSKKDIFTHKNYNKKVEFQHFNINLSQKNNKTTDFPSDSEFRLIENIKFDEIFKKYDFHDSNDFLILGLISIHGCIYIRIKDIPNEIKINNKIYIAKGMFKQYSTSETKFGIYKFYKNEWYIVKEFGKKYSITDHEYNVIKIYVIYDIVI